MMFMRMKMSKSQVAMTCHQGSAREVGKGLVEVAREGQGGKKGQASRPVAGC
jgi:hypothetical protein